MGRPSYQPDEVSRRQVKAMAGYGVPEADIARVLDIDPKTLRKHSGRGSGKSHFFAGLLIEDSLAESGLRSVCIREVQKSLKDSAKRLLEDKLASCGRA